MYNNLLCCHDFSLSRFLFPFCLFGLSYAGTFEDAPAKGGRVGRFFEIFDHPTLTGPGRFKKSQGELKAAFLREKVAYRGIYTQYLAR